MKKYIGITIGPITKTLEMARKPMELWTASYLFSFFMKKLALRIKPCSSFEIISPDIEEIENKGETEVGLYPDRLYLKKNDDNTDIRKEICLLKKELGQERGCENLFECVNVKVVEAEIESEDKVLKTLNAFLDVRDLEVNALNRDVEKNLRGIIRKRGTNEKDVGNYNPFISCAFKKDEIKNISSFARIASTQLSQIDSVKYGLCFEESREKEDKGEGDSLISVLKASNSFMNRIKTPHKYICMVYADGDNVGKIISSIGTVKNVKEISACLASFARKAVCTIKKAGGLPIYAGGDDLLFISPVLYNDVDGNEHNVFDLLGNIDACFEQEVKNKIQENGYKPSMSYGVAIDYYKYPLYEIVKKVRELLYDKAKKVKDKNAIACQWRKGSGASVYIAFSKYDEELGKAFFDIISHTDSESLVNSVMHKIRQSEELFKLFFSSENLKERVDAFFENYLKKEDKNQAEKGYLTSVRNLLYVMMSSIRMEDMQPASGIHKMVGSLYGILGIAKFLKGLEEEKDV